MDQGVAVGIAQGLNEGLSNFFQTRNQIQELALKKKLANAQTSDAISKLLQAGGSDAVKQYGPQLGLLSGSDGSGYLPPQQAQPPQGLQQQPDRTQGPQTNDQSQLNTPAPDSIPRVESGAAPTQRSVNPNVGTAVTSPTGTAPAGRPSSAKGGMTGAMMPTQSGYPSVPDIWHYPDGSNRIPGDRELAQWNNQYGEILKQMQMDQTPAGKLAMQTKQTELSNKKLEPFDKTVTEYEGNDVIKKARDVGASLNEMQQNLENGNASTDRNFAMNYLIISRNGQIPRGMSPEQLKVAEPSAYAEYKELMSTAINNKLPQEKKNQMIAAASNNVLGLQQSVSGVQNRFNQVGQVRGLSQSATGNEPFNQSVQLAKALQKKYPNQAPTSLGADTSGLLSQIGNKAAGMLGLIPGTASAAPPQAGPWTKYQKKGR